MRHRYENWVDGPQRRLARQPPALLRRPDPGLVPRSTPRASPTTTTRSSPDEADLPDRPASADVPPGYNEAQRGQPGGFIGDPDIMDTWATSSLTPQIAMRLGRRRRPVRPHLPHGPAPPGPRHHPHLAVLHRRARPLRARLAAVGQRRAVGLDPRPRPQEDVEVEGQRRHPDRPARAVRRRRRPLLGRQRPPRHRHRVRRRRR